LPENSDYDLMALSSDVKRLLDKKSDPILHKTSPSSAIDRGIINIAILYTKI